jgi:hypothetical protein
MKKTEEYRELIKDGALCKSDVRRFIDKRVISPLKSYWISMWLEDHPTWCNSEGTRKIPNDNFLCLHTLLYEDVVSCDYCPAWRCCSEKGAYLTVPYTRVILDPSKAAAEEYINELRNDLRRELNAGAGEI